MSELDLRPPEVVAPSLQGLAVTVPPMEPVTADEVLTRLRAVVRATTPGRSLAPGEALEEGDEVVCDGIIYVDGQIAADGFIDAYPLVLDAELPLHWHGLLAGLVGTPLLTTTRIPVLAAAHHPMVSLRGKAGFALVKTREAARREPAPAVESPEALASLGVESLAAAVKATHAVVEREHAATWYARLTHGALAEVTSRARVELRPALVDGALERTFDARYARFTHRVGLTPDEHAQAREAFLAEPSVRAEIEHSLKAAAVLRALINARAFDVESQSGVKWLQRVLGENELSELEAVELLKSQRLAAQSFVAQATWLAGVEALLDQARVTIA